MLQVEGISVAYGDLVIIDQLSLYVRKGEMVALIGANGAGKTTLLRAICGLEPLRQGKITFQGKILSAMPTYRIVKLGLAMVPSNARVFGKFTVDDNLLMGSLASSSPNLNDKRDQIYCLFPILQERAKQRAETLSGGERQMLAMARALMGEPQFLLMDEPTAGLAPKLVGEVFGFITRLRGTGLTIFIVEEKVEHVLKSSDRAYVLQNGRVIFEGTPEAVHSSGKLLRAYIGNIIKD
jgi:branched-chain amino acid transport system ATP-binding protein